MYSAIKSALILFTLHVQGRNVHKRGAMTCLCVSFGEKVGQHDMTMCDFCLRGYLSSIKRHGLPKNYYANLSCAFYCLLILISNGL